MNKNTFTKISGPVLRIIIGIAILFSVILVGLVDGMTLMSFIAKMAVSVIPLLLFVLLWKFKGNAIKVGMVVTGLILIGPIAVWLSQLLAYTPPIVDTQGKELPSSIASLEKIQVGGVDEWVIIRGKDINNPVLLYLSGGPGGSELGWVRTYNPALEDHFVVVVWEQPGAGKSYAARPYSTLTVEQMVSDGLEVSSILKERFHKEKIYVLGSSWGSILGVKMVQRQPDLFYAYIGMGQMINSAENDQMSYVYALETAQKKGDLEAVKTISQNGPPPYSGEGASLKYSNYLDFVTLYDKEAANTHLAGNVMLNALRAPEFGLLDQLNFYRGLMDGMEWIYIRQLSDLDFDTQAQQLNVPVFLMEGRFDHNANTVLAQRWFDKLQAPYKEWIWFEHSHHSPCFSEPGKFTQVLIEKVVAKTLLK